MVHCCCVPGCSTRSNRETDLSFFSLPLKNKRVMKRWIHAIRRKNLPLNRHTRICSRHFVNAEGRRLYADEVPSLCLPGSSTNTGLSRKAPRDRSASVNCEAVLSSVSVEDDTEAEGIHVSTQTDVCQLHLEEIADLQSKVISLEKKLEKAKFRLDNIKDDDGKITFYTGFPSFLSLKAFYTFLGPSVENL